MSKKTSGMHRCIPDRSFQDFRRDYLFFLDFFFAAILFSSRTSKISAGFTDGARVQFTSIDTGAELVKRKVNHETKKVN